MTETRLKIAGVVISLLADGEGLFDVPGVYSSFLCSDPPEVKLRLHYGETPEVSDDEPLFDSEGIWSLYGDRGKWVICFRSPVAGPQPYKVATFESDFCAGDIYLRSGGLDERRALFPLRYPLGEVLMINLLSRERGVLLHACGVHDREDGLLFAGMSGAGKSTMADLWAGRTGVNVLSDDRVIVRRKNGGFWMYGTPWHGDARIASPDGAPLKQIFIIRHSSRNRTVPLGTADAASKLLARSFPTFWNADGMAFTVDFLGQLAQSVPCNELGFVPSPDVVDFVRCESAA